MHRSSTIGLAAFGLFALSMEACGGRIDEVDRRVLDAPKLDERPTAPTRLTGEDESALSTESDPCPERPPSDLDWCPRPYKCKYKDTCSQRSATAPAVQTFECSASRWTRVSVSYPVVCPAEMPAHGAACELDCVYPSSCHYETPCGDVWATCQAWNGAWHLAGSMCASADAGAGD
ncbi:MAG: hypothetical protein KF819_17745 [Labilithrix sp.]|nr:hypothetical protein [Labilithrix sp.]